MRTSISAGTAPPDASVARRIPDVSPGVGNIRNGRRFLLERWMFPRLAVVIGRGRTGDRIRVVLAFLVELAPPVRVVVRHVANHVRVGHALRAPAPSVAA